MSRITPEGKFKAQLKRLYRSFGDDIMVVDPIGSVFSRAGVHDHILCVRGLYVSVEVKAEGGRLTPAQKVFGLDVFRAGGVAFVVHPESYDHFAMSLQMIVQHQKSGQPGFPEFLQRASRAFELGAAPGSK